MMILSQVRNYLPSHQNVLDGGWDIAKCVERSYDLEGMTVGTVAAGRNRGAAQAGTVRRRAALTDRFRLPAEVEDDLGLTFHAAAQEMVPHCDVVTINAPLHPETEGLSTMIFWRR
jgi:formate dehydrogenase